MDQEIQKFSGERHLSALGNGPIAAPPVNTTLPTLKASKIKAVSTAILQARAAKKNSTAPAGRRTQATFPIMKPPKSKYVRVNPSPDYRQPGILTYTDTDTSEIYYVSPELELPESLADQTKITDLYAAQMHDGTFFVWFVHRSDTTWFRAAKKAVRVCTSKWHRVVSRKAANTYDLYPPEKDIPEPDWSTLPPFSEMIEDGFEDRLITSVDHPALRKIRGCMDEEDE